MFAATPPRRTTRSSTRNDSDTVSSRSGSSCSTNRPGKRMRWSEAMEPETAIRVIVVASVPVVVWFVGSFDRDAEVVGLVFGQFGELDTQRGQMQPGDLLVEVFGQGVHADGVALRGGEQLDLGDDLVGERVGHHE